MRRRVAVPAATAALLVLCAGACSSGGSDAADGSSTTTAAAPTKAEDRPAGPVARTSGPLRGGNGIFLAAANPGTTLPESGWVEEEYTAEGTATSYRAEGDLPTDGQFDLAEDQQADYRTRIVVRRPADEADFNGTVVVEWLNVSGGLDANPDYTYLRDELVRKGNAWVGVSAQMIGIEGGPVAVRVPQAEAAGAGKGIKVIDPERYGDLVHPGDAFSYDIFTQVGRALRDRNGVDVLGGLRPERVLAVGESQSAFALTTYVNGVQPLASVYDGFLIHSRGGASMPLGAPGQSIDIAGSIGGKPTKIRTDGKAPVIVVQTETDLLGVLGAYPARQDDSARFRWWEAAGTAHADRYQVNLVADSLGCPAPLNDGPSRFVVRTALRDLDRWVRTGTAPPEAPRLETDAAGKAYVRDEYGNAEGGIRTPVVDVPVDTLSGESAGGSIACILFGSTTPLTAEQLAARYPSRADYEREFRAATRAAIASGFLLADDRAEMLAEAEPDRIAG